MEQQTAPPQSPLIPLKRIEKRIGEISKSRAETAFNMSGYDLEEIDRWRDRAADAFFDAQNDAGKIPIALHSLSLSYMIFKDVLLPAQKAKMEKAQSDATKKYISFIKKEEGNYQEVFQAAMKVYSIFNELKTDIGLSVPMHKKSSAISAIEENIES